MAIELLDGLHRRSSCQRAHQFRKTNLASGGQHPHSRCDDPGLFIQPSERHDDRGTEREWINVGSSHTVGSNKAAGQAFTCAPVSSEVFDSGMIPANGVFTHTFANPGTFAYHCEIHGCGMSGSVTVSDGSGQS